jgi:hypothetical protein
MKQVEQDLRLCCRDVILQTSFDYLKKLEVAPNVFIISIRLGI